MNKRKNPLLKNEIEILQTMLEGKVFPTESYRLKLVDRLEDLKRGWYKVGKVKIRIDSCKKYIQKEDRTCGDSYGYRDNEKKRSYVKTKNKFGFDLWLCSKCEKFALENKREVQGENIK